MNRKPLLKYLRVALAIVAGALATAIFLDITRILPSWAHIIADIQFVPMVVKGIVGGVLLWVALTALLGRIYCSVVCPLGILQDVIGRVKTWTYKLTGRSKKLRMKYQRPLTWLRYGVLAAVVVPYVLGLTLPLLVTDPYSNFGRITSSLFRPVAVWINNGLASVMNKAGNYSVYVVQGLDMGDMVAIFAAVVLIALVVMVWRSGRLWCNTVCPVGTLLGVFSRRSLVRIKINQNGCNSCGSCAAVCKSHCIDIKNKNVDGSRCVACFNCIGACKKGALAYVGSTKAPAKQVAIKPVAAMDGGCNPCSNTRDEISAEGASRRQFIKGSLLGLSMLPAAALMARTAGGDKKRPVLPMPPGAGSRERFTSKCTACQLCVTVCPTGVLKPALMENGLTGVMQPYMRFKVESFCNFECHECIDVCPTHAIDHISLEEKKLTRVGIAHFHKGHCVVHTDHQDCGACAEHCPTGAVHMIPYVDGLTIPKVDAQYCIGCGGCESICPVTPKPAILITGLDVQEIADPPLVQEAQTEGISDFGF